jgi:glycosyltransferase involved in cell wall biosynthesis
MGHQVKIVTYHNGGRWNGLSIERNPPIPWRTNYEVGSSRHKLAFDALLGFKMLQVALRDRPDIIHAHLHEGALVGFPAHLLTGAPLIFDFQGSLTGEMVDHHFLRRDGMLYGPARRIEQMINKLPNAVNASSMSGARLLREEFACRTEDVRVVPDCVNAEWCRPDVLSEGERRALRAGLGIPSNKKVVVYLGLLAEYQGINLLLEAAQQICGTRSDLHFLIMGYPGVEVYRALATQLGIAANSTFTGKIEYTEAPRYLALGDVAVAPKMSATEGNGKILNYMAMALPTVAFETEVSREYLGAHGFYAKAGDAADLARALVAAVDQRECAKNAGNALRQRALADYTWEKAGQQIVDVYQTCLH